MMTNNQQAPNEQPKKRVEEMYPLFAEVGQFKIYLRHTQGEKPGTPFSSAPTTPWYAIYHDQEMLQLSPTPDGTVALASMMDKAYRLGHAEATKNATDVLQSMVELIPVKAMAESIKSTERAKEVKLEPAKNAIRKNRKK